MTLYSSMSNRWQKLMPLFSIRDDQEQLNLLVLLLLSLWCVSSTSTPPSLTTRLGASWPNAWLTQWLKTNSLLSTYRVCQKVDKNQRPSSAFRVGQVQPILLVLLPVEPWRVGSTSTTPQIRRKVWKSGGLHSNVVGIMCPPGWDRVNWSAKNCGLFLSWDPWII